jgi:hypothetical protein
MKRPEFSTGSRAVSFESFEINTRFFGDCKNMLRIPDMLLRMKTKKPIIDLLSRVK